jgi:hypothetical protein
LIDLKPRVVNVDAIKTFLQPAHAYWPDHIACWSLANQSLVPIPLPDTANETVWVAAVRSGMAHCGL